MQITGTDNVWKTVTSGSLANVAVQKIEKSQDRTSAFPFMDAYRTASLYIHTIPSNRSESNRTREQVGTSTDRT